MKRGFVRAIVCWAAAAAMLPAAALGQDEAPRYRSWSAGPAGGTQEMVEQLRALIDEAGRANAADPRFLADLKALADAYDASAPVEILHDDFADGDYTRGVAWTVSRGRWWVEDAVGLRSLVAASPTASTPQQQAAQPSLEEELAANLLGNLLGLPKQQQQQQQQSATAAAEPAAVQVAADIPNAFSARLEITSRARPGELRADVFQGAPDDGWGYRLSYAPGAAAGLTLMRVSRGAATVIGRHDGTLDLEDGRRHVIDWARSLAGEMTVAVDGRRLIAATDRRLRDPFDGFALTNLGGDFALRDISIRRGR